jgi:hypothetical protein
MRTRTISTAIKIVALGFVLSAISLPLFTEDFTVSVPVELKNLPLTVTKGYIEVAAWFNNGSTYREIGGTSVYFDIIGGNYSNSLVLKFNANPGQDPNQVTRISSAIWLLATGYSYLRPSILSADSGPLPGIVDNTQPFREISNIPIVKP